MYFSRISITFQASLQANYNYYRLDYDICTPAIPTEPNHVKLSNAIEMLESFKKLHVGVLMELIFFAVLNKTCSYMYL